MSSLLDDVRALVSDGPPDWDDDYGYWRCELCGATRGPFAEDEATRVDEAFAAFTHDFDCPWRAMPRLVAVLEAAERVADAYQSVEWVEDMDRGALNALVAALQEPGA